MYVRYIVHRLPGNFFSATFDNHSTHLYIGFVCCGNLDSDDLLNLIFS